MRLRPLLERVGLVSHTPGEGGYDAFISYSHALDGKLAPALQRGLQRFAKPWYRPLALRIFRDEASLSADPGLWTSIVRALDRSRYFLLLASPQAAASPWVAREAAHWCASKSSAGVLIAITDGELVWNDEVSDFDWGRTTALPETLRGVFSEEPRFVDLRWARTEEHLSLSHARFQDAIADLAAPLHGLPKDVLAGEEVRQHRRTIRVARVVALVLAGVTLAAIFFGVFALVKRGQVERQLSLAQSRQVATQARLDFPKQLDRGVLLSLTAYGIEPTVEARDSLIRAAQRTDGIIGYLRGHQANVVSVAFSPDGRLVASASEDKTVVLWRASDGRRVSRFPLSDGLRAVAFSPDGSMLACGTSGAVSLWDPVRHRKLAEINTVGLVEDIVFSPDGRTIAVPTLDGIILWNVRSGKTRVALPGQGVVGVAFTPDGRTLVVSGFQGSLTVYDTFLRRAVAVLRGDIDDPAPVSLSPDGALLASGEGSDVVLWDLSHRRRVGRLRGHTAAVFDLAFSPDGTTLATGAFDNTVMLWDTSGRRRLGVLRGHTDFVNSVAFSPSGRTVASGGDDHTLILWDVSHRDHILLRNGRSFEAVAFSPDGRILAAAGAGGGKIPVILWSVQGRRTIVRLSGHTGGVWRLAFSPDGSMLASAGADRTVIVSDVDNGRTLATLETHAELDSELAFSPDGAMLATAGEDSSIVLWDTRRWTKAAILRGHTDSVASVAFSPDGATLASAGLGDNAVFLWDVHGAEAGCPYPPCDLKIGDLIGHRSGVLAVAFSPDGRSLASGSFDKSIIVWDLPKRRALMTLRGVANDVNAVKFADDGRILISASSGGNIMLWEVATARPLAEPLHGHVGSVEDVAVSPDGTAVASAGDDGTVRLWAPLPLSHDVNTVRAHLCAVVRRNLTSLEARQILPGAAHERTCAFKR